MFLHRLGCGDRDGEVRRRLSPASGVLMRSYLDGRVTARHTVVMKITHDPEARTFSITGTVWWDTYPIDDLQKWLAFYLTLQAEHPKANGAYDATVAGLEALAKELGVEV